ncbi:MAG: hypothetical protein IPM39_29570 [Chloroflexi bacterium]|nr:hypothetical protein [Chloroflexota bacterium]
MTVETWAIIQPAIETLVTLFVGMLLIALGVQARTWLTARVGQANLDTAVRLIRTAVLAIEQEGLTGAINDKKEAAIAYAEELLAANNIHVDIATISHIIESLVYDEFNRWYAPEDPTP